MMSITFKLAYFGTFFGAFCARFLLVSLVLSSITVAEVRNYSFATFLLNSWPFVLAGLPFWLSYKVPLALEMPTRVESRLATMAYKRLYLLLLVIISISFAAAAVGVEFSLAFCIFSSQALLNLNLIYVRAKGPYHVVAYHTLETILFLTGWLFLFRLEDTFYGEMFLPLEYLVAIYVVLAFLIFIFFSPLTPYPRIHKLRLRLLFRRCKEPLYYNVANFFRDNVDLFFMLTLGSFYNVGAEFYLIVFYTSVGKLLGSAFGSYLISNYSRRSGIYVWENLPDLGFIPLILFLVSIPVGVIGFMLAGQIFEPRLQGFELQGALRLAGVILSAYISIKFLAFLRLNSANSRAIKFCLLAMSLTIAIFVPLLGHFSYLIYLTIPMLSLVTMVVISSFERMGVKD